MSGALVESGRHDVVSYSGPTKGLEALRKSGLNPRAVGDPEEILADPAVDAVIVAGDIGVRPAQLRRALQSERHVLCVYPPDHSLNTVYEADLIQRDTRRVLLPLLVEGLHPGVARLAELAAPADGPLGRFQLALMERHSADPIIVGGQDAYRKAASPGWELLRALRGDIAEVSAYAESEEGTPDQPLLVAGRFQRGGLFQTTFLTRQPSEQVRLEVIATLGRADLVFSEGWPGPARLSWQDRNGALGKEAWNAWNPGPSLVALFEAAVAESDKTPPAGESSKSISTMPLSWQDAVRAAELDDAARRSLQRHRVSTLEYPTSTEEVGFKGTMTLVGCSLIWGIILLAVLSAWLPWLGWAILPLLAVFLVLQLLRWIVPKTPQ
jgi:predicted dehydrogenase